MAILLHTFFTQLSASGAFFVRQGHKPGEGEEFATAPETSEELSLFDSFALFQYPMEQRLQICALLSSTYLYELCRLIQHLLQLQQGRR